MFTCSAVKDRCKIIFHLNQTLISRKNHLVTGVRWLGIVYLVILIKDLKPFNVSKISFLIATKVIIIYLFCFLSVYI
jgi:hypothetical protein